MHTSFELYSNMGSADVIFSYARDLNSLVHLWKNCVPHGLDVTLKEISYKSTN